MDLALNNLQRLICHKTQQTKPNHILYTHMFILKTYIIYTHKHIYILDTHIYVYTYTYRKWGRRDDLRKFKP